MVILGAALAASWSALRVLAALGSAPVLAEFGARPGTLVAIGLVGFCLAGTLAGGLWRGKRWALWASLAALPAWLAWVGLDSLVLQTGRTDGFFHLLVASLAASLAAVLLLSRRSRQFLIR